eukprot:4627892-Heterocapsa_arctica.AAC.1
MVAEDVHAVKRALTGHVGEAEEFEPEEKPVPDPRDVARVAGLAVVESVLGLFVRGQLVPKLLTRPRSDPLLPCPVPHIRGLLIIVDSVLALDLPVRGRGSTD